MARNQLAKISGVTDSVNDNMVVTFKFSDDVQVQTDLKELFPDPAVIEQLPFIIRCLIMHGYRQKGPDAYAGSESAATAREKLQGVKELLWSGQWATKREGGTESSVENLALAYCRAWASQEPSIEKDYDTVLEKLKALEPKDRNVHRRVPQIKLELAKIAAEQGKGAKLVDL